MKSLEELSQRPRSCGMLFIDSGAHSLFNIHAHKLRGRDRYNFYKSDEFWAYVDSYAAFVKDNLHRIDYYVNVDVITNAEMSWEVQEYLEKEHGLDPVPVIHAGAHLRWVDHYLERGYKFVGVGGVALEGTKEQYLRWADMVFEKICPSPKNLPIVRTHGFAMTDPTMLVRYPWWSTDSSSWAKCAAFGSIYIPKTVNGKFTFPSPGDETQIDPRRTSPLVVTFSDRSASASIKGRHWKTLSPSLQSSVLDWLKEIDVPLGETDENGESVKEGVRNTYGYRGIANMRFFERLAKAIPPWPWAFRPRGTLRSPLSVTGSWDRGLK